MNISKISISGFKALQDINFNPDKIHVIIGKNNTGKTSLLEAISFTFNNDILKEYDSEDMSPSVIINYYLNNKGKISLMLTDDERNNQSFI
ncbi:AAA family ATPase [Ferroplasma sp.]|uniref:AAA family ATPase n=1 Tax=Ferroplasma sp. TaxID=2591003 RepID=UPI00307E9038